MKAHDYEIMLHSWECLMYNRVPATTAQAVAPRKSPKKIEENSERQGM